MKEREVYTAASLELNLFFLRITKEHAIFLTAGFTPANTNYSREAGQFKAQFENLLARAIHLGDGIIGPAVLASRELVTDCTLAAEQQTSRLTGIAVNEKLTRMEQHLTSDCSPKICVERSHHVKQLNQQISIQLNRFIRFTETVLENVCSCQMFTNSYPSFIEHILSETRRYQELLTSLETENACECSCKETDETFWNHIMMEHALFMRGLLDPVENKMIVASNTFAETYAGLLDAAGKSCARTETEKFRDFNQETVTGILQCRTRSMVLPLLADHVLREANHYLRILK